MLTFINQFTQIVIFVNPLNPFLTSVEKQEETFSNENEYEEKQYSSECLENELSDNEVILLFITKTRLLMHGSTGAPFEFPRKKCY